MRALWLLASGFCFAVAAGCGGPSLDPVCGPNITCSSGGTYRQCTDNAATGSYFLTSDGTDFPCYSASNCSDARKDAIKWCSTH